MEQIIKLILAVVLTHSLSASELPTVIIKPLTGDTAQIQGWQPALGEGLAEMLVTEISKLGKYDVLESTALNDLIKEIDLGESGYVEQGEKVNKGGFKGADFMFLGKVTRFGSKKQGVNLSGFVPNNIGNLGVQQSKNDVRIDWRFVDVSNRRVLKTGSAVGEHTGIGFDVGANIEGHGGGIGFQNQEFMNSALGKATVKALAIIINDLKTVQLPQSARRQQMAKTQQPVPTAYPAQTSSPGQGYNPPPQSYGNSSQGSNYAAPNGGYPYQQPSYNQSGYQPPIQPSGQHAFSQGNYGTQAPIYNQPAPAYQGQPQYGQTAAFQQAPAAAYRNDFQKPFDASPRTTSRPGSPFQQSQHSSGEGKIVAVAKEGVLIVTLGAKHGLKAGDWVAIFEATDEVPDKETGQVAFSSRGKYAGEAFVEVVQEERSKIRYKGPLEMKKGMHASPIPPEDMAARGGQ